MKLDVGKGEVVDRSISSLIETVEQRLRNFEGSLEMIEKRATEARQTHALAIARLEEKLGAIGQQESKRVPMPVLSSKVKKGVLDPARRGAVRNLRAIERYLARRISPRAPAFAILVVVLALLAGAGLLHAAHAKMAERGTAGQSASADPLAALAARAEGGDAKAQSALAFAYLRGNGIRRDIGAAVRWSQAAAAQGDPDAEYLIGSLIQSGTGIRHDPQQAFAWFRRSADAGNLKAMHNLAIAYVQGNGTPKDPAAGATWFARAASAGYVDSAFDLAVLYEQGLGVPQNEQQALHWYRLAANAGDRTAATRAHMLETAGNP
jgi:hypothetical protein